MHTAIVIGFVVAIIMVALWLQEISIRRRVAKRMQNRDELNPKDFGKHFFSLDLAPIATRLHVILARHVDVDLSRLHPDDGFIDDLEMDELDSLSTLEFTIDVEQEFGIKIPNADATRLESFRDVVQYISTALAQRVA
jgi:acyl carrier protein